MKKTILALATLATSLSASAAEGQSNPLAVSLDATYVSTYVFRGLETAGASIQPSLEANYRDFYAGVWYSDDFAGQVASETDLYAGYNFALTEIFSADVGLTRYLYERQNGDSTEAFVGVQANVLLSPSFYSYYDLDNESTTYIASIGHSVPVAKLGLQVDLSALVGYVQRTHGSADYTYWGVGASIPYQLSENAKLTAAVNYSNVGDSNPSGAISSEQDQVVYSLGVAVGF
jgi:uncharacterized protein (TIGR02001 family)